MYDSSGYFRVEVTPLYRDTLTHVFMPKKRGQCTIGAPLDSGEFRVPISSKSDQVWIVIKNSSPYPNHIMSDVVRPSTTSVGRSTRAERREPPSRRGLVGSAP